MIVVLVLYSPNCPPDIVRDVETEYRQIKEIDELVMRPHAAPDVVATALYDGFLQRLKVISFADEEERQEREEYLSELRDAGQLAELTTIVLSDSREKHFTGEDRTNLIMFAVAPILENLRKRASSRPTSFEFFRTRMANIPNDDPYKVIAMLDQEAKS